ncbi:MAG: hypothetical protein ACRDZ7_03845 [Acidimicrobiia bacterium]
MRFLEFGAVTVAVVNGRAAMPIAERADAGMTPAGVAMGLPWKLLASGFDDLRYDENEGLWYSGQERGAWYEVARPPRGDEHPIDPPLVPEQYDVTDPERAIVRRIFVM